MFIQLEYSSIPISRTRRCDKLRGSSARGSSQEHLSCKNSKNDREGLYFFLPRALTSPFSPMPRVILQSGQYHFVVLGGISFKPTHSRWNHSFSHWTFVSTLVVNNEGKLTSPFSQPIIVPKLTRLHKQYRGSSGSMMLPSSSTSS